MRHHHQLGRVAPAVLMCSSLALSACATGEEVSLAGKLPAGRAEAAQDESQAVVAAPANSGALLIGGTAMLPGSLVPAPAAVLSAAGTAGAQATGAPPGQLSSATLNPFGGAPAGSTASPLAALIWPEPLAASASLDSGASVGPGASGAAAPMLGGLSPAPGPPLVGAGLNAGPPGLSATAPGLSAGAGVGAGHPLGGPPGQLASAGAPLVGTGVAIGPPGLNAAPPGPAAGAAAGAGHPLGGPPGQLASGGGAPLVAVGVTLGPAGLSAAPPGPAAGAGHPLGGPPGQLAPGGGAPLVGAGANLGLSVTSPGLAGGPPGLGGDGPPGLARDARTLRGNAALGGQ
jgi:hypothetical protein